MTDDTLPKGRNYVETVNRYLDSDLSFYRGSYPTVKIKLDLWIDVNGDLLIAPSGANLSGVKFGHTSVRKNTDAKIDPWFRAEKVLRLFPVGSQIMILLLYAQYMGLDKEKTLSLYLERGEIYIGEDF